LVENSLDYGFLFSLLLLFITQSFSIPPCRSSSSNDDDDYDYDYDYDSHNHKKG
jgi:hypothetical protein